MPDREPVDVAMVIKEFLAADLETRFPGLSDNFEGGWVRLELPAGWSLGSPPVLVVADDGDPLVIWPVGTSPTIRITSWTSGRETKYARAVIARLLTTRIPGIAKLLPGTGILEARDKTTRGDLASFTVRARARTAVPQ